jgi:hypothetical protein
MARRLGSAMISNTDSTLLVYCKEYMRVKAYNDFWPTRRCCHGSGVVVARMEPLTRWCGRRSGGAPLMTRMAKRRPAR